MVLFGADDVDVGVQDQPVEDCMHQPSDLLASYNEDGRVHHGTGAALTSMYRTEEERDLDGEEIRSFVMFPYGHLY